MRVQDRQSELVRIARDITRIAAEIMAENFSGDTLMELAQQEFPTDADIRKQAAPVKQQLDQLTREIKHASEDPETRALAAKNPDGAKKVLAAASQQVQQLQQQMQQIASTVTIDQLVKFLRDNRMRPFALDIETDSTVAPDEMLQQQRATEMIKAVGDYLGQAMPMVEQVPQSAPMAAAFLKFIASKFRVGREIEGVIDQFAEQMSSIAQQPKPSTRMRPRCRPTRPSPSPERQNDQRETARQTAANRRHRNRLRGQAGFRSFRRARGGARAGESAELRGSACGCHRLGDRRSPDRLARR